MQILLRKNPFESPFRTALLDLMAFPGEELILSTGYANISFMNSYNKPEIMNSIIKANTKQITLLGGMLKDQTNCNEFELFLNELQNECTIHQINLKFYRANNNHWHSKIALKIKNGHPVASIIGSSNLTASAFSVYRNIPYFTNYTFNHEADIFIWDNHLLRGMKYKGLTDTICTKSSLLELRQGLINKFLSILNEDYDFTLRNMDNLLNFLREGIPYIKNFIIENLTIRGININIDMLSTLDYIHHINTTLNKLAPEQTEVQQHSVINITTQGITQHTIINDIYNELIDCMLNYMSEIKATSNGVFCL